MTPVALWTGRLPGLRPLPRAWTLWATALIVGTGVAASFGLLGPVSLWASLPASVVGMLVLLRHRWPTSPPLRQRSAERPQGPDERAVLVEFRHDGDLLGWDAGVLWFEHSGIGFIGRTVSFVVPRAILGEPLEGPLQTPIFRAPRLTVKLFETTIGIVPLEGELRAQTTLARIDALPDEVSSETILPPSSMHPDLIQRGLTVRRRFPYLLALTLATIGCTFGASSFHDPSPSPLFGFVRAILGVFVLLASITGLASLPPSIRRRLPTQTGRDRSLS